MGAQPQYSTPYVVRSLVAWDLENAAVFRPLR